MPYAKTPQRKPLGFGGEGDDTGKERGGSELGGRDEKQSVKPSPQSKPIRSVSKKKK